MKLTVESKPMHQRRLVMSLRILGECVRQVCGQGAAAAPLPTGWLRASWRPPGAHIPSRVLEVQLSRLQLLFRRKKQILVVRSRVRATFG